MANILAVYGTTHGHTARIVERIASVLGLRGHRVTLWKGDSPPRATLDGFGAVLVAGSVIYGRHHPYLRDFVRRHVATLNRVPSAFVSVCGALMGTWAQGPEEARKYIARFLDEAGWRPTLVRPLAGELAYTRYGRFTRWVRRLISRRTGRAHRHVP